MPFSLRDVTQSSLQGPTGPLGPTGQLLCVVSATVTNSAWVPTGELAVSSAGGHMVLSGKFFTEGSTVIIGSTSATSTFVDSTTIRCVVPALTPGTYHVYVSNADGSTAQGTALVTVVTPPAWTTPATLSFGVDKAIDYQFSSTGATTYTVTSGSLPPGTALSSSGAFTGTVTGLAQDTAYNFTIVATNSSLQSDTRSFTLTITVRPSYVVYTAGYNDSYQLGHDNQPPYSHRILYTLTEFGSNTRIYDAAPGTAFAGGATYYYTLFLGTDNQLYWAGNPGPNLGNGTTTNPGAQSPSIRQLSPWTANDYQHIATNGSSVAIASESQGVSVMYNGYSFATQVTNSAQYVPNITKMVTDRTTYILLKDQTVMGYYGPGSSNFANLSSFTTLLSNITQIGIMGSGEFFALDTNGALWAGYGWSDYSPYTSGSGRASTISVLQSNVSQLSVTGYNGYIIGTNGWLYAWGDNAYGQTGQMTPAYGGPSLVTAITRVGTDADWEKVQTFGLGAYLKKTGSDALWVLGHSGTNNGGSGYPYNNFSLTIGNNATSVPTLASEGSPYTAVTYSDKVWRGGVSHNVLLQL